MPGPRRGSSRVLRVLALLAVIALSGWGVVHFARQTGRSTTRPAEATAVTVQTGAQPVGPSLTYERLEGPARTVVRDATGAVLATFTDDARTAVITGTARTLREPKFTAASITTTAWVRLAPQAWAEGAENAEWFGPWFEGVRADQSPDVLAVAMEYADGAAADKDADGVRFRGDAAFGPIAATGAGRLEQSDFYDYLGVSWSFPDGVRVRSDRAHYGATDCSGFVRLVYGYRMGYPVLGSNEPGPGLPRRAYAMAEHGPGVAVIPNKQSRVTAYDLLQPGDLLFFEVEGGEDQLDHSAIYFGLDSNGHHRFMSSRERANGPTFGDLGGTSLLDDGGLYSKSWRAARRI